MTDLFNVDRNNLTGSLPESIGLWSDLFIFSVSGNRLTGPVPMTIANWTSIGAAYFEENSFNGSIPVIICTNNATKVLADCLSEVFCSCCSVTPLKILTISLTRTIGYYRKVDKDRKLVTCALYCTEYHNSGGTWACTGRPRHNCRCMTLSSGGECLKKRSIAFGRGKLGKAGLVVPPLVSFNGMLKL
jgi:hypothetical protein